MSKKSREVFINLSELESLENEPLIAGDQKGTSVLRLQIPKNGSVSLEERYFGKYILKEREQLYFLRFTIINKLIIITLIIYNDLLIGY
jgi:hypothetical protein